MSLTDLPSLELRDNLAKNCVIKIMSARYKSSEDLEHAKENTVRDINCSKSVLCL